MNQLEECKLNEDALPRLMIIRMSAFACIAWYKQIAYAYQCDWAVIALLHYVRTGQNVSMDILGSPLAPRVHFVDQSLAALKAADFAPPGKGQISLSVVESFCEFWAPGQDFWAGTDQSDAPGIGVGAIMKYFDLK